MEHWGTNSLSTELPHSRLARPSAFFCYLLSGKRNLLQLSHWHQKIQLLTAASPLCSIPSGVTTLACLKSKNFRSSGCPHVDCSYQQVNFNFDHQTIMISLKGGNAKSWSWSGLSGNNAQKRAAGGQRERLFGPREMHFLGALTGQWIRGWTLPNFNNAQDLCILRGLPQSICTGCLDLLASFVSEKVLRRRLLLLAPVFFAAGTK